VPDSLTVDVAIIGAAASTLRTAASEIPRNSPLGVAGCGSSAVVAAAESFNMWAKVTTQVMSDKLTEAASDADNAVTTFLNQDTNLAAAVTP
jgi:hypothetical protein